MNFSGLIIAIFLIVVNWNLMCAPLGSVVMRNFLISIIILNYIGLVPHCVTLTSLFWGNFIMATLLWFSFLLIGTLKNRNYFLSVLLPFRSPKILWVFLTILELVRILIRPVTLSLRLACNIITGHILLFLLININVLIILLLLPIVVFELCVATIQAIVYSILLKIYLKDFE